MQPLLHNYSCESTPHLKINVQTSIPTAFFSLSASHSVSRCSILPSFLAPFSIALSSSYTEVLKNYAGSVLKIHLEVSYFSVLPPLPLCSGHAYLLHVSSPCFHMHSLIPLILNTHRHQSKPLRKQARPCNSRVVRLCQCLQVGKQAQKG